MEIGESLGLGGGIVCLILGLILMVNYKKVTSNTYFRILVFIVALMLIGFGLYMGISVFYWNE